MKFLTGFSFIFSLKVLKIGTLNSYRFFDFWIQLALVKEIVSGA